MVVTALRLAVPVLLERSEELRALSAALEESRTGAGTTVWVGGEAGSGKSTLAAHFLATATGRVLRSGCDGATTAAPLGPLMDIAPVLAVDVSPDAGEPVDRIRLFAAVRAALVAEPTVWLVEDLHWADAPTLDLIRYLARRSDGSPLLLLLTFRDDEAGVGHPVRVLLGELATVRRVRRVVVPSLTRAAVAELARGSGVDVDALCDRTGGNPFYVTEVLAGTGGPVGTVPATVRDAVLARAARLSGTARAVLEAAAVIGSHPEIDVLAAVADQPLAALDECLAAGVLLDGGGHVTFRHELAREAIASSVLPGRRQALHRATYGVLRASGIEDDRRLAQHAAGAGDGPDLVVHAPRAAERAAALGAHREAAEHYRAALRWGHLLEPAQRADLLERLSYECYLIGELPEGVEARGAALVLRRADGDRLATGSALRWLSRLSWYRLRNADAERYAQEAVETLARLPESSELAMAYSNLAQIGMLGEDLAAAQEWGDRAVELAHRLGDVDTEVHALNNIGTALMLGGQERGEAVLRESLDRALALGMQEHVARAYTNLTATLTKHRRFDAAEAAFRAGIDFCADRDLGSWSSYLRGFLSFLLLETGRWDQARLLAQDVVSRYTGTVSRITPLMVLGRLETRTGAEGPAGSSAVLAWREAEPSGEAQRVLVCAAGLAEAAWTRDDPEEVRRVVDAVWPLAVDRGIPWEFGELLWWLHRVGDTRGVSRSVAAPFARMVAGDAAAAAAAWDAVGSPFWAALARTLSDDPGELKVATAALEKLGATATLAAVVRDLRRRGVAVPRGPRAASRANPAGLTEREMEVLGALAEGLSNAAIAARFVLSERTVGHHVSAVLRKLGESNRSRAVVTARQRGIIPPSVGVRPGR